MPGKGELYLLKPKIQITNTAGLVGEVERQVPVGLDESHAYLFPFEFQADFDRATRREPTRLYRLFDGCERLKEDGLPVVHMDFSGFSPEAEQGIKSRDELAQMELALKQFLTEQDLSFVLPSKPAGNIKLEEIQDLVTIYYQILYAFNLNWGHNWVRQFPDSPVNYFPFPLAVQHSPNLFRMAFNIFQMQQLVALMEAAYRGNDCSRNLQLDRWVVKENIKNRGKYFPFSTRNEDLLALQRLDLSLKIALIKESARRRQADTSYMAEEDWQSLDLFLLGSAYRDAVKFFLAVNAEVFTNIVNYAAFFGEFHSMQFDFFREDLSADVFLLTFMMAETRDYLGYHGAQVIKAYEKTTGKTMGMEELMALPIPFDLFGAIDLHYAREA